MKDIFNKYDINSDDKLIIACSGGSDSMFLVSEILKIHPAESIIIGHFNHQMRGEESNIDEGFVKKYSQEKGIRFEIGTADIKSISVKDKTGIEETARIERYRFLNDIKSKYNAKYILTAHHLDDNIETFLFNLIRGTRLNGLVGIEEISQGILRPLLHITKEEILNRCKKEGIIFIHDSTNQDDVFLRNHLRLNIIPGFEKINPSYQKSFDSLIGYFSDLKSFLNDSILNEIKLNLDENLKILYNNYVEITGFTKLSTLLQNELIAYIFKLRNQGTIGLTQGNIAEIIRFIGDKGNCTKKEIKKLKLFKKNGKIYF